MDEVFKALGDATRRELLDRLMARDGQTLGELEQAFPKLSRFAVMKHLGVLERAGLIGTRRSGRFKHHYLNPVPIQEIGERWISRFAAPWARGMTGLKCDLEAERVMTERPEHVYHTIIQTTAERLWRAITDPALTREYFFGLAVRSTWQAGDEIAYLNEAGEAVISGRIIDAEPPRKVSYTFEARLDGEPNPDPASRVTFEIEPVAADACKLTVVHDGFEHPTGTYRRVGEGWPTILSGLKTYLETGAPLRLEPEERA